MNDAFPYNELVLEYKKMTETQKVNRAVTIGRWMKHHYLVHELVQALHCIKKIGKQPNTLTKSFNEADLLRSCYSLPIEPIQVFRILIRFIGVYTRV